MRYPIGAVLKGYAAHRKATIDKATQDYRDLLMEQDRRIAEAEDSRPAIANELYRQAELIRTGTRALTSVYRDALEVEVKKKWNVPAQWDVDRNKREQAHAETYMDTLANAPEPELVKFLKTMQSSGESYISAHGVRQAGFDPKDLTAWVLAAPQEA